MKNKEDIIKDMQEVIYQMKIDDIEENPDSEFVDKLAVLPTCRFIRNYQVDNLNHDVFLLYF